MCSIENNELEEDQDAVNERTIFQSTLPFSTIDLNDYRISLSGFTKWDIEDRSLFVNFGCESGFSILLLSK
jgi:hypothetical protein